ncbi:MAG TPA: RimK/LysX family protein [Candidatus Saccharimonadales bacterium]|nr:RimK/LysX family protein [Candidatus Saccharimonadales bacterium]
MKKVQSIGNIELVSLPDGKVHAVPAKIDTGADSSAVWAINIKEKSGQLSYELFGKSSPYHSGQTITTSDYKLISVKNSFGQSEFRYRVKLKLKMAARNIQATFTLADRSSNRYPVLIGRKTLQNKFVVDVSRKKAKKSLDVLLLSMTHKPVIENFVKNLQQQGRKLKLTYATYDDLSFKVGGASNQITLSKSGRDIASFGLVYFKTYTRHVDLAGTAAAYLKKRGITFIDDVLSNIPATNKIHQYMILSDNNIAVPLTLLVLPEQLLKSYKYLEDQLKLPFILKDAQGSKGEHNYLIKDQASFKKACKSLALLNRECIAQEFIENDEDYRVLVFGTKIELVIKRARKTRKTHLNNTSQGAKATLVKSSVLPANIQTASLSAAKLLNRQIAGVDFIQDNRSGLWYCLEVNYGPQLATGTFTAEKQKALAAYLERKSSK